MKDDLRAAIAAKTAEAAQHLGDALLEETLADPQHAQQSALYHAGEPDPFHSLAGDARRFRQARTDFFLSCARAVGADRIVEAITKAFKK